MTASKTPVPFATTAGVREIAADKIVIAGATTSQITAALKTAHTVKAGGSVTTTLTIGTDKITVVGGALTKTNFT